MQNDTTLATVDRHAAEEYTSIKIWTWIDDDGDYDYNLSSVVAEGLVKTLIFERPPLPGGY
jgi:hypothetical protein